MHQSFMKDVSVATSIGWTLVLLAPPLDDMRFTKWRTNACTNSFAQTHMVNTAAPKLTHTEHLRAPLVIAHRKRNTTHRHGEHSCVEFPQTKQLWTRRGARVLFTLHRCFVLFVALHNQIIALVQWHPFFKMATHLFSGRAPLLQWASHFLSCAILQWATNLRTNQPTKQTTNTQTNTHTHLHKQTNITKHTNNKTNAKSKEQTQNKWTNRQTHTHTQTTNQTNKVYAIVCVVR